MVASFCLTIKFCCFLHNYRNCRTSVNIVIVAQQTVSSSRNMRPPLLSSHKTFSSPPTNTFLPAPPSFDLYFLPLSERRSKAERHISSPLSPHLTPPCLSLPPLPPPECLQPSPPPPFLRPPQQLKISKYQHFQQHASVQTVSACLQIVLPRISKPLIQPYPPTCPPNQPPKYSKSSFHRRFDFWRPIRS